MSLKSRDAATRYLQQHALRGPLVEALPDPRLSMVAVIPSHEEPDELGALRALAAADRPSAAMAVEVLVVLNASEADSDALRMRHQASLERIWDWAKGVGDAGFRVHGIDFPALPKKHAGVGLARKLGMDEGIRRLQQAGNVDSGVLVCFDADCQCDRNYWSALEAHFESHPRTPGCSIYFEHPLDADNADGPEVGQAITEYELHLRYHVEACRWAGHPYAFQTVGSSMAVRAPIYCRQGGMNRRQAGEDFYFLQKVIPLGGFTELNATRVIPSPRPSQRVPFGTGRAVGDRLTNPGAEYPSYPFQAYRDLRCLVGALPEIYQCLRDGRDWEGVGCWEACPSLLSFLQGRGAASVLAEILINTRDGLSFQKRFFRWFDGFMVMKWLNQARNHPFGSAPVTEGARQLLEELGWAAPSMAVGEGASARAFLEVFRSRARLGPADPFDVGS